MDRQSFFELNRTDVTEDFLNEIEDPFMRTYRLLTMQPRRQHQEPQQDNNEIENLTKILNSLSETATAEVEPDTVGHEENQQTQQETLANTVFCLFCQKKIQKVFV